MDGLNILKTTGAIIVFLAGAVIVPVLTALGLSAAFGWNPRDIYFYFAAFYVISFIISFIYYLLKDMIKKEIIATLTENKLIPVKGNKNVKK